MPLNAGEWLELQGLLHRARAGGLDWTAEQRMRSLLSQQNPSAGTMNMEDLVKMGLVLVGLYFIAKMLSKN